MTTALLSRLAAGFALWLAMGMSVGAAEFPVAGPDELNAVLKQLKPGDSVVLKNGTWSDVDLVCSGNGTPENPITFQAQTPGKVVITGRSRLRIAGEYVVVSGLFLDHAWHSDDLISFRRDSKSHAKHCRLTNCALIDCNGPDAKESNKWVSLYGEQNRVDHCYLAGKQTEGATLVVWLDGRPNHHQIDHNHFGPRPRLNRNGGETIRIGTSHHSMSTSATLVEQNLFEECNGEAEIISSKSCENVFRYNRFVRSQGALTLRHGNRCTVEGNLFLGENQPHTGGVRIIGEDHRVINNYFADLRGTESRAAVSVMQGIPDSPLHGYFQVKRALIAHNTLVHCRENLRTGLRGTSKATLSPQDCRVINNLIISDHEVIVEDSPPGNWQWSGNLVNDAAQLPDFAGLHKANLQMRETDGIWRPTTGSDALDAASSRLDILMDFEGQPRDERPDAGCDEVLSATAEIPITHASSNGPDWRTSRND